MKITKPFIVLYRISGDSGVSGRGVFLSQFSTAKRTQRLFEDLGSMCDDRCTTKVLYTNFRG
jgi:hypothetical protein